MSNMSLVLGLVCIGGAIVLAVIVLANASFESSKKKKQAEAEAAAAAQVPVGAMFSGAAFTPGVPGGPQTYAFAVPGATSQSPVALQAPTAPPSSVPPSRLAYAPNQELPPLMQRLRRFALRLSPSGYAQWLRRRLDYAGNPPAWPADRILAFKGIGLVVGLILGALIGLHHGVWLVVLAAALGILGFVLPDLLIFNAGDHRQMNLLKGLPDALDMMTVCVEAGLGFDAALSRVALTLEGPIAIECARVLQEMQFGMSRIEALRSFADRSKVSEVRTFVSALVQSSELGISVGVVLREQAKEMRIRRRQRAEEKAQKLQVKIVVPLVFCLLPALFIIVIGPGILNIIHGFGNAHH